MPSLPVFSQRLLNGMGLLPNISFCEPHICANASVKSPFIPLRSYFTDVRPSLGSTQLLEQKEQQGLIAHLTSCHGWAPSWFSTDCWNYFQDHILLCPGPEAWGLNHSWLPGFWTCEFHSHLSAQCVGLSRGAGNVLLFLNLITECSVALPAAMILICVTWLIKAIPVPGFGQSTYFQDRLW